MLNLGQYTHAFFDCDGVILNSNKVKSEAFTSALDGESPELVQQFVQYHQKNGGISRFVKFEYFFKHIKKQLNYKKDLALAIDKYAQLSFQGLLACTEIMGVRDILEGFNKQHTFCFVVSGGEQEEVRKALSKRDFSSYFYGIYGSPENKQTHLSNIDRHFNISKGIYFGDAKSDYEAAKAFDMDFVYIYGASEWENGIKFCQKNDITTYKDFTEFE